MQSNKGVFDLIYYTCYDIKYITLTAVISIESEHGNGVFPLIYYP